MCKLIIVMLIVSVILEISESYRMQEYTRIKRGKYNGPPQRIYRRPPFSFPNVGFSYTPPPGYNVDDKEPPPNFRPYKVSKRPTNEELGEVDINNIVDSLSQQDLEKIIEAASEKNRLSGSPENYIDIVRDSRKPPSDKFYLDKYSQDGPPYNYFDQSEKQYNDPQFEKYYNYDEPPVRQVSKREENVNVYRPEVKEVKDHTLNLNGPHVNGNKNKPYAIEYVKKENYMTIPSSIIYATPEPLRHISIIPLEGAESSNPFNFVNTYINNELNNTPSNDKQNFNLNTVEGEVILPQPENLREEQDYEVSSTHNVPKVLNSDSYKIEDFGNLPVMDYTSSKLHTVSSYHVPHYTITSPKSPIATPRIYGQSNIAPPVEPAPPASVAESEAHLKAIKIWTHKSRGTAYTLHNDGTLSLEKPDRPKPSYGYP